MIRFLFRLLALAALAIAVIMAVIDATRSLAASAFVFTPLGESWRAVSPDTVERAREMTQTHAAPFLWDPVALAVLALPGWLIFAALALVFQALGQRRRRRVMAV